MSTYNGGARTRVAGDGDEGHALGLPAMAPGHPNFTGADGEAPVAVRTLSGQAYGVRWWLRWWVVGGRRRCRNASQRRMAATSSGVWISLYVNALEH